MTEKRFDGTIYDAGRCVFCHDVVGLTKDIGAAVLFARICFHLSENSANNPLVVLRDGQLWYRATHKQISEDECTVADEWHIAHALGKLIRAGLVRKKKIDGVNAYTISPEVIHDYHPTFDYRTLQEEEMKMYERWGKQMEQR